MIRLKGFRRLLVGAIYALALLVTIGIPLGYLALIVNENLVFAEVNRVIFNRAIIAFGCMTLLAIIYLKWIKKWFNRKLQAIAVVNELGMYTSKSHIFNRILKTIEYTYPFVSTLVFFLLLKTLFFQYPLFEDLVHLNKILLIVMGSGGIIYLIGDLVRVSMTNAQKVEDTLDLEMKKDKLYLKRLRQEKRKENEAMVIQRQLEALRNIPLGTEENNEE